MDRREFFQTASSRRWPRRSSATSRSPRRASRACRGRAAGGAPRRRPGAAQADHGRYTRNLHWLRDPDQIAEAAIEMTCGGVNPTIQAIRATSIREGRDRSCPRS